MTEEELVDALETFGFWWRLARRRTASRLEARRRIARARLAASMRRTS